MALMWGQVKTWSSESLSVYVGTASARRDTPLDFISSSADMDIPEK